MVWCGGNGGVVRRYSPSHTVYTVYIHTGVPTPAYIHTYMNANFCMNATPFSSLCKVENKEKKIDGSETGVFLVQMSVQMSVQMLATRM